MSDKVNWDYDGISLIDPKQTSHMLETLEALREYGLDDSIVEKAFIPFSIDQKLPSGEVKLVRTSDSVSDADELQLFLLPDSLDEERSPYAEFLDHITRLQIKMLNDTFHFEEDLSVEDLEEEIRDIYSNDYMEGKAIHAFREIMDILEYAPDGYSLEDDDEDDSEEKKGEEEETYDEIEDLPDEDEEDIDEDETMHWDDDEEEDGYENDDYSEDFPDDEDDDRKY